MTNLIPAQSYSLYYQVITQRRNMKVAWNNKKNLKKRPISFMLYDGIFKCVINYRLNVVQVFSPGSQTPPENFYRVLYPCTNGISCGNFRKLPCRSLSFIRRRKFVLRLIKFHSLPRPCSRNCCNSYLFNSASF